MYTLPGRTPFPKSLSQMLCLTWEGFGAWFGGQAPSFDHFHLQLPIAVHDGNVHIPCKEKRHSPGRARPRAGQMATVKNASLQRMPHTRKSTGWSKLHAPYLLLGDHFKVAEECFDRSLGVGREHDPQGARLGNNKWLPNSHVSLVNWAASVLPSRIVNLETQLPVSGRQRGGCGLSGSCSHSPQQSSATPLNICQTHI